MDKPVPQKQYYDNFKRNHPSYSESVACECGGHYTYFTKYRHQKSAKHAKAQYNKELLNLYESVLKTSLAPL